MQDLQDRYGLSYLFISHDLAVIDLVCDEVLVLQRGRCVEQGAADTVLRTPAHPYTRHLLAAAPAWLGGVADGVAAGVADGVAGGAECDATDTVAPEP
jgi:ABC-type dipeptide/oligopeptide/nickel transport system ATPase component